MTMKGGPTCSNKSATDYPALSECHVAGVRLFADRCELLRSLNLPEGAMIAEVGVSRGEFSEFLIRHFEPRKFVAFDTFMMHEWPDCWGTPTDVFLGGTTHLECFLRRMKPYIDCVSIEVGPSCIALAGQMESSFDLIYIDALHDQKSVKVDADLSARILKPRGVLVFNDYVLFDPFVGVHYGVVQTVNDMVVNQGWKVVVFAWTSTCFAILQFVETIGMNNHINVLSVL